jgi:hypothetical protein
MFADVRCGAAIRGSQDRCVATHRGYVASFLPSASAMAAPERMTTLSFSTYLLVPLGTGECVRSELADLARLRNRSRLPKFHRIQNGDGGPPRRGARAFSPKVPSMRLHFSTSERALSRGRSRFGDSCGRPMANFVRRVRKLRELSRLSGSSYQMWAEV